MRAAELGTLYHRAREQAGFHAKIVLMLLFVSLIGAGAQSLPQNQSRTEETQVRGYWTDPSTGLMWAGKDNGKDVTWKKAMKYCRELRLAGSSDWRLATLSELEAIYDKTANAPGLARLGGPAKGSDFTWHVKGNLFLTGNQWVNDQNGHSSVSQAHCYFDFNEGRSNSQASGFPYSSASMRALCVRGSGR
jgi:Protein of unknown function (DUF1566)